MRTDIADFFGVLIGLALFGLYSGLFFATLWMVRVQGTTQLSSPIMVAIIVIYLADVLSTVLDYVFSHDEFVGGSSFAWVPFWSLVTLYEMRDWRIIVLPAFLLLVSAISGVGMVTMDILQARSGASELNDRIYLIFSLALSISTLSYNVIVTVLIVGRLWWAHRQLKRAATTSCKPKDYTRIIVTLVERGSLYSLTMLTYIISAYVGDGSAKRLFTYTIARVIGIAFTAIVLQRSLGYLQPGDLSRTSADVVSGIRFASDRTAQTQTAPMDSHLTYPSQFVATITAPGELETIPEAKTDLDKEE